MSTTLVGVLLSVVLGALVGSFLNVVILRTKSRKSFIGGRSRCPKCKRVLPWTELIPIMSYIFLRGRCRKCRKPISTQYPLVEGLTMVVFALLFVTYGIAWVLPVTFIGGSAMILLAVYDFRWQLLPDAFTIIFAIAAIVITIMIGHSWIDMLIGGAAGGIFFALQYILSRRRWVGSGDIFLGMAMGLLLGWKLLALALFFAYVIGAMVAAVMILTKRLRMTSSIAFGPYLLAATFIAWICGQQIISWYSVHALFW